MTTDVTPEAALPPLPKPWTAASTLKCTACGAPYEPQRVLAPNAAAIFGGRLMTQPGCKCGNSQFAGTFGYGSPSPAKYTDEAMQAYAREAIALDRAARALAPAAPLDVDVIMSLADDYAMAYHHGDGCETARSALRSALDGEPLVAVWPFK